MVLRVTTEGGFIGPAARLAQLPEVVVYADGRILTPAPAPAIYPGPLVPVESVRDVGAAELLDRLDRVFGRRVDDALQRRRQREIISLNFARSYPKTGIHFSGSCDYAERI